MSLAFGVPRDTSQYEDRQAVALAFSQVRDRSMQLVAGLAPEDMVVQSMTDASPTKWHLAHTTWFFETFVLGGHAAGYGAFDESFAYLFNSYYENAGPRRPRSARGMLTRPTLDRVFEYRQFVDAAVKEFVASAGEAAWAAAGPLITLGLHHEMQHQELLLTDLLHAFSGNPTNPAYQTAVPHEIFGKVTGLGWQNFDGGIVAIGHDGEGFGYDCEGPRHESLVQPFGLASRPVTNGEWLEFMADGGYGEPLLWLADGWMAAQQERWQAPLYWQQGDDGWQSLTLSGLRAIDDAAPVCHISLYEADAYARWAGKRLPRETEWEVAAGDRDVAGNLLESGRLCPEPASGGDGLVQLYGDVWEWTQSAYGAYPGFRAPAGAVGEYNGKFMCNQIVLRGGSCVTAQAQLRPSYRNFFYPHQRWQFAGLRLAQDI
ncbi:MAG: ergothioneine biosynthesis protein EgtB [Alphaproteobacteria bacterium]